MRVLKRTFVAALPLLWVAAPAFAEGPTPPPPAAPPAPPPATVPAPPPAGVVSAPPATVPAPPPPGALPAGVEALPAAPGTVRVHIRTKELVTVERRTSPEGDWQFACETPCDANLPTGDQYRIVGPGISPSNEFALGIPKKDVVNLYVAPAIKSHERVGEVVTIAGVVLFAGAVIGGLAAANPSGEFQANGATNDYNWNVIGVATGLAVTGLVAAAVGGAVWYDNTTTRVAGDVQAAPPARGSIEPRTETGMRSAVPNVPTYTTSLFTATF